MFEFRRASPNLTWFQVILRSAHLDVLGALKQPSVKVSGVAKLLLLNLKVDVGLPEHLGEKDKYMCFKVHFVKKTSLQCPLLRQLSKTSYIKCTKIKSTESIDRNLRHVESWLSNGEFEDGAGSFDVSQDRLQLGELDPGGAVLWSELQVFLIQLPAAVELTELQLQLNVSFEQLVFGAFTDRCALKKQRLVTGNHVNVWLTICDYVPIV